MNTKLFSLDQLSFSFNRTQVFFEHVSFSYAQPGLIFVQGKNGVGKSTLFRLLQGDIHQGEQAHGILKIGANRYDISAALDRTALRMASRAMIQESAAMVAPSFTGFENLAYARFKHFPDLSLARVDTHPSALAMADSIPLHKRASELSGGQRQLLALLMITQQPLDLLFLDEPTAALDTKNARLVMDFVQQLAVEKHLYILCISHDTALVKEYAHAVLHVEEGNGGKRMVLPA